MGAAAKALINRGVPTRVLPDDDTPFYYARACRRDTEIVGSRGTPRRIAP